MPNQRFITTRDLSREGHPYLPCDLPEGTFLYKWPGATYGTAGPLQTAMSQAKGQSPFFAIPNSAFKEFIECEDCEDYPESGEPCPNKSCIQEWLLPQLTVSTGAAYAVKPEGGPGLPDIRIALMDREEANTVPVQRDAYLHQIVKRCNAYTAMQDALDTALGFVIAVKVAGQKGTQIRLSDLPGPYVLEHTIRNALHPKG